MTPQEAYNLLKDHDPGHTVALGQTTIPQLYGDKAITVSMNPATQGVNDSMQLLLTVPPNPQVIWQVQRTLTGVTSTKANMANTLIQKYGTPWDPDRPSPRAPGDGTYQWFFDEQGRSVNPTTPKDNVAMKTCLNQVNQAWSDGIPQGVQTVGSNFLQKGDPRQQVVPFPPLLDPSKSAPCNNVIFVRALLNGGFATDETQMFTLVITMSDYSLQRRKFVLLNDALNNIVQHGVQQQLDNAQQQSVPKF
jgi:hypothetical protein